MARPSGPQAPGRAPKPTSRERRVLGLPTHPGLYRTEETLASGRQVLPWARVSWGTSSPTLGPACGAPWHTDLWVQSVGRRLAAVTSTPESGWVGKEFSCHSPEDRGWARAAGWPCFAVTGGPGCFCLLVVPSGGGGSCPRGRASPRRSPHWNRPSSPGEEPPKRMERIFIFFMNLILWSFIGRGIVLECLD